jgi:tetratricopeptide (TPR) repeat protein
MHRPLKLAAIVGAGFSLASFSPLPGFSDAALDALDPSRLASLSCGVRRAGSMLANELLIASAIAAPASAGKTIPLYPDLAASPFPVSTRAPQARRYFSQGLILTYGFNHAGAVRSFREAQRLDPECAMCWWGEAVALGPNINAPMDDRDHGAALDAMDRAMALRSAATPMERALIEAVARRYSRNAKADRAALDAAYADAMLDVARRFPGDDDVAVLAAEAAMDTSPWNYWEADKKTPVGRSGEAVRLVEAVLRRNPAHVQANHLYIHLLEASDPKRAEAAADRLANPSAPSAAHLVHMPGHIYQLRGRHADSIRANIAAARADEVYIRSAGDNGLVRYGYYPHNIHFIVTSAQMAGDMRTAVREARRLRTVLDPETSARLAWIQAIDAAPYMAMAQFAEPKAILAMPAADPRLPYAAGMRHYARGVAYAGLRDRAGFDREMAAIESLRTSGGLKAMIDQGVPAADLLMLAELVARGRFASAQGRLDEAITFYRRAAEIEASIPYQEPAYWYYPVKQSLGAALFRAGRHAEASDAFRGALAQTPNNGWALYGLGRSEAAQGHKLEAAAANKALSKAWIGDARWLRMDRL